MQKIELIRTELDAAAAGSNPHSEPASMCSAHFDSFTTLSDDDVMRLITKSSNTSCSLDPIPTPLVVECLDVLLPVLTRMLKLSLETGCFPDN